MARHDQKPYTSKKPFVCTQCKASNCDQCIDVARAVIPGADALCSCKRTNHSGEPIAVQIADPFTGTVHGPGATISADGEVTFDDDFRERFKRELGA